MGGMGIALAKRVSHFSFFWGAEAEGSLSTEACLTSLTKPSKTVYFFLWEDRLVATSGDTCLFLFPVTGGLLIVFSVSDPVPVPVV